MNNISRISSVATTLVVFLIPALLLAQVPGQPRLKTDKNLADVELDWNVISDADGYKVMRTEDLTLPSIEIAQTTGSSYSDVGAVPGQPVNADLYYYSIVAHNTSGDGPPSNRGFKLNVPIVQTPGKLNRFVLSFPYFYLFQSELEDPTASDICEAGDLAPGGTFNIAFVDRFVSEIDQFQTYFCAGMGTDFLLEAGVSYTIVPQSDFVFNIVGSHDDDFNPGGPKSIELKCEPGTLCNSYVSYPYHGAAQRVDDLCPLVSNVSWIGRFLPAIDQYQQWNCVYRFGSNFHLLPGEGLVFGLISPGAIQFPVQ